jgi:hypothetical protein
METDTELSVIFNRADGIDKDPKYADIFSGIQQKSLFARMGHNSGITDLIPCQSHRL